MKKVFIDCGAYDGSSIRKFRNLFDPEQEYTIHSFEPPSVHGEEKIKKLKETVASQKNVILHEKVVWIRNGTAIFYDSGNAGASLLQMKTWENPTKVECVDLSSWIKENFSKEDHVILKLDVEGAEYEIIKKMDDDGTFELVDKLYGEIHGLKCGKRFEETMKLLNIFEKWNHKLHEWNADSEEEECTEDTGFYDQVFVEKEYDKWERKLSEAIVGFEKNLAETAADASARGERALFDSNIVFKLKYLKYLSTLCRKRNKE
jgi:FkbM family methyltransferase